MAPPTDPAHADPVDVVTAIERLGGCVSRAALIAATNRAEVDRALRNGVIVRVGQGRYVLPAVSEAEALAHAVQGVLSHTSAALHHGWEVKWPPERPHVLFPRNRNVPLRWRDQLVIHRGDLSMDERQRIATDKDVTLAHCLRTLPVDEALVIADSALRHGDHSSLRRAVRMIRGRGQVRARAIAAAARGESANPFESVARAICRTVTGLHVEPQVQIRSPYCQARPDLVDVERRLVVECDSFEFHADRAGYRKDLRRYSLLVADGWMVLRLSWEDVMLRPEWVHSLLARTIAADPRTWCGLDLAAS